MAVDPLHLRVSGFAISEGLTIPFPQARGAPLFRSGAGPGVAPWPFRCFLSYISPTSTRKFRVTHFRRLLSSMTHLMPSIVQLEHVTSPSAVMWYLCITSHRTFLALQAAHAFAALLLTGFGFPLLSTPAVDCPRFFKPESVEPGDCEALEPLGSIEVAFSGLMMSTAFW
jgi:hypothetical protein